MRLAATLYPSLRSSANLLAVATILAVADCRSDAPAGLLVTGPPENDPAITRIAIAGPSSIQMFIGGSAVASVVAFDAQGDTLTRPQVQWVSDNPAYATVDANGTIVGTNVGTTVIRALLGKLSASLTVTVAFVDGMALLPEGEFGDTIQLAPGQTLQLSWIQYDRHTSTVQPTVGFPGNWSSSASSVATVSATGLVTAIAAGDARITLSLGSPTDSRVIRVAPTSGSVSVQIVDAAHDGTLRFRSNNGDSLITLDFGGIRQQTLPAGTVFVSVDGVQLTSPPYCNCFDGQQPLQQFIGFLPAGSKLTLVATHNSYGFTLAPLWSSTTPFSGNTALVRVMWAVDETYQNSYNVYLEDVGAPMTDLLLRACYLDWPYAVTAYSTMLSRPFDIVLQRAKFGTNGPEAARFTVTPASGVGTMYIITGAAPDLNVTAVPDPK